MKTMLMILLVVPQLLFAQDAQMWREVDPNVKFAESRWEGLKANRKELNTEALDEVLEDIRKNGRATFVMPHPTRGEMTFDVKPANLMAKGLQEKYPHIRTYKGTDKNGGMVRLDVYNGRLHAIAFTGEGTVYLDPESAGSKNYMSYFRADYKKHHSEDGHFFEEPLPESERVHIELKSNDQKQNIKETTSTNHQIKKFRIAIATDNKFSAYHGGTVEGGLAAVVTTLNRVTAVFEKDVAITFELVAENDKIIYTSSSTDPYAGLDIANLRRTNVTVLDSIIGHDNYDVGHVFSGSQLGGQANVGQVCFNGKGSGASSKASSNTNALADIVAHEIGHQFKALHSYNGIEYYCAYRDEKQAYEPGSGSTIMSYAGNCLSDDYKSERDYYFHAGSIEVMRKFVVDETKCGTWIDTDNTAPTVEVREGGFVIPINTPFVLEAETNDEDGDALTYCWEQYDLGPGVKLGQASGNSPLFRSFIPEESNKRYFPTLEHVVNNTSSKTQLLPTYTRDLNFVVTVRDNNVNGPATTRADIGFTSTDQAGPFEVTSTFEESPYDGFSTYMVEWDVANTDQSPVNCQKVNILFSDNGGASFDYIILNETNNDGAENVQLPNIQTTKGRILVEAADNIFYNVNNANFSINAIEVAIPEDPTNLAGTKVSNTKIALTWTDNSDVENGFIIERKSGSDIEFAEIARVGFDIDSFEDQTIENAVSYEYKVASYNETGVSGYTNTVSFGAGEGDDVSEDDDRDDVLSAVEIDKIAVLYPNPATSHVYIPNTLVNGIDKIIITDLNGKVVSNIQITDPVEVLDTSGLKRGLYMINFYHSHEVIVRKLIKE